VAILSGPEFNAPVDIDKTSLTFGRIGDEKSLAFCNSNDDDEKRDIHGGLVCHFYISQTGFQSSDTEGILKGKKHSGVAFLWSGFSSHCAPFSRAKGRRRG
jgi:hypothetical protein